MIKTYIWVKTWLLTCACATALAGDGAWICQDYPQLYSNPVSWVDGIIAGGVDSTFTIHAVVDDYSDIAFAQNVTFGHINDDCEADVAYTAQFTDRYHSTIYNKTMTLAE